MKLILVTLPAAISTKLTMPIHQNELYIQVTWADGLMYPISKRVGILKSWISTYDSSSLVRLWPTLEDNNVTKWWPLRVPGTVSQPSYHFSIFSALINLSFKFQKTWSTSFHFHINLTWICKSKIWLFKDLWRLCVAACRLTGRFSIACCKKHQFSNDTQVILMGTQILKVLVVFVLSSTTVKKLNSFFYMWVISFKIINKHYLNLIQKACIMIIAIRNKTQWIMLEATIWSQVIYNQGM